MKVKNIVKLSTLVVGMVMSVSSWATIGEIDEIVAYADIKSGDKFEKQWVKDVLGMDVSINYKEDTSGNDWDNLDGSIYGSDLKNAVSYFIVKFGNGKVDVFSHYLYKNVGDLKRAIIDLDLISGEKQFTIGRVSHFTGFDGDTPKTDVPEPATLVLMGLGLLGMSAARRKKA